MILLVTPAIAPSTSLMNKSLASVALGLAVVVAGLIIIKPAFPAPAPAPAPGPAQSQDATITWSMPQLTTTMFPGTASTTVLSFRSSQKLSAVTVWITPSLDEIASAKPVAFQSIAANQDYQVTLTLTAPPVFQKQSFGGTIHVRDAGTSPRTYAIPLTVTLQTDWVAFVDPSSGLTFRLPLLGVQTTIQDESGAGTVSEIDIQVTNPDGSASSLLYLLVYANPAVSSLLTWFHHNVDPTGILISSGAFLPEVLANGQPGLVNVAPIPPTYQDGPVAAAYMLTSGHDKVIAIVQSQDAQFTQFGYTQVQIADLLKSILGSVQ